MTDISRMALEIADEQIGDLTNIYHRYENMRSIAFALRDALDEAQSLFEGATMVAVHEARRNGHRAGRDDAIEASCHWLKGTRYGGNYISGMRKALPYKPQEDVSDG